jgi:hypothetical protein
LKVASCACALAVCAPLVACAPTTDAPEAKTAAPTTAAVTAPTTPELDIPSHDADFEQGLSGVNEARDTAFVAARNDWSYVAVGLRRSDGSCVRMAGAATTQQEDDGSLTVTLTDELTGAPLTLNVAHVDANEEEGVIEHTKLVVDTYPDFKLFGDSGHTVAVMIYQMDVK